MTGESLAEDENRIMVIADSIAIAAGALNHNATYTPILALVLNC